MEKEIFKLIYHSMLGDIFIESDGTRLTKLLFTDSFDFFKIKADINAEDDDIAILNEATRWLDLYFKGINPCFLPLISFSALSAFQVMVTKILLNIPYGKTLTYNDIAKEIAKRRGIKKMSAQAVGGAVGNNPICIIIPCHRVIGQNGNLVGYGGKIFRKVELLRLEGVNTKSFYIPKRGNKL